MEEITFVVQGPIAENTASNLESIRNFYPRSKIILSTWPDQCLDGLQFDCVMINKDPGPVKTYSNHGINTNRLIVSSINGLSNVKTKRAVKIRTDIGLTKYSTELFSESKGHFFNKKIVGLDLFFRNPFKSNKLFHIGDLFMAGLTDDLKNLWSLPLVTDFDVKSSFRTRIFNTLPVRVTAEQYLWLAFMNKNNSDAYLDFVEDIDLKRFVQSETSLALNFEVKTAEELGLSLPSKFFENGDINSVYSQSDFNKIISNGTNIAAVKKYCRRRNRNAILKFLANPRKWI